MMNAEKVTAVNKNRVDVQGLKMYFPVTRGLLRRKVAEVKAVDNVSFHIKQGETLGLVGESGSGKTTIGRCLLRLYEPTGGKIFFNGQDVTLLSENQIRHLRRKMTMVFQDPFSSLDPRQSAGSIIGEPLIIHKLVKNKSDYEERIEYLFRIVGLDPSMRDRVPHEFSGGQRQRIGIARAIAGDPSLIVCDEPVSALDVSIQAQIINLLQELQSKIQGLTYLFIAHDLSVVRHISNRIAIMYLGRIVEITDQNDIYENPLHPYTKVLLSAVPVPDPFIEEKREHKKIEGEIPSPLAPPSGCHFHPRCPLAIEDCKTTVPKLVGVGGGHEVACIRVSP